MTRTALFIGSCALACAAAIAQTPAAAPAGAAASTAEAPVSKEEARKVVEELAGILGEEYVFPDVGTRYAEALRAKAAAGAYDGAGTVAGLGEKVTADLRAVSADNHLRLMPAPTGPAGPGPNRAPGAMGDAIEVAREIAPGVAYIRFTMFPGDPNTVAKAEKFMRDHADAKTIIFDIRTHRGGGLAEMDAMFPYLFAQPTSLVRMDTRASIERMHGSPVPDGGTMRRVPTDEDVVRREHHVAPHPSEKRLFDAKVYVLTSGFTGSAAEHFALSMKRTKRAILIGEATGGAGHFGGMRPVGDKFAVFVPVGRTFDPDTGKGWEGSGVAPDVEVPAEGALIEALTRSGVSEADAARLSAELHPKGPMSAGTPRRAGSPSIRRRRR